MTAGLVGKFQSLVIEDLNVKGMMAGLTPKAQADAGMGEIRRQLVYKGQWRHCKVMMADRYYPSSKTCSVCGVVNAKLKRERYWTCGSCGTTHERNLNAAVNLRNLLTLPSGRGATLRDGKALTACSSCRETGPDESKPAAGPKAEGRLLEGVQRQDGQEMLARQRDLPSPHRRGLQDLTNQTQCDTMRPGGTGFRRRRP